MNFLVTRPLDDAKQTARALHESGHSALIAPVMKIRMEADIVEADLQLDNMGGLVITSANGLRAFCDISDRRDLRVYAVGDSSAALARESGFDEVMSAAGDTTSLSALIAREYRDPDKPLLHIAGKIVAGDLVSLLDAEGISLRRKMLYHADLVDEFPIDIVAAFTHKHIDAVLIYSPRTGKHFADLVEKSMLQGELAGITVYCLSPAVAETVSGLDWKAVKTARDPHEKALFELFEEDEPVMTDKDQADKTEKAADKAPDQEPAQPRPPVSEKPGDEKPASENSDKTAPKDINDTKDRVTAADDADSITPKTAPAAPKKAAPAAKSYAATPPRTETVTVKRGPNVIVTLVIGLVGGAVASLAIPVMAPMIAQQVPQAAAWLPKEPVARDELANAITAMTRRVSDAGKQNADSLAAAISGFDGQFQQVQTLETTQQALGAKLDALPAMLQDLSNRLQLMENREDPDYQAAMAVMRDMEARMRQVEATAAKAEAISVTRIADQIQPYMAEVKKLSLDVDGMEKSVANIGTDARYGDRKAAVALAIGQLRRVVERGGRIDTELFALRDLLSGLPNSDAARFNDAVAVLTTFDTGKIPGQTALIDLFDQVDTRFGQDVAQGSDTWVATLAQHFDSLVKIRRVSAEGVAQGDDALRFAKAYEALKNGDLDTALDAVSDADADYAAWRGSTVKRRDALAAVDGLEAAARTILASQATGAE